MKRDVSATALKLLIALLIAGIATVATAAFLTGCKAKGKIAGRDTETRVEAPAGRDSAPQTPADRSTAQGGQGSVITNIAIPETTAAGILAVVAAMASWQAKRRGDVARRLITTIEAYRREPTVEELVETLKTQADPVERHLRRLVKQVT